MLQHPIQRSRFYVGRNRKSKALSRRRVFWISRGQLTDRLTLSCSRTLPKLRRRKRMEVVFWRAIYWQYFRIVKSNVSPRIWPRRDGLTALVRRRLYMLLQWPLLLPGKRFWRTVPMLFSGIQSHLLMRYKLRNSFYWPYLQKETLLCTPYSHPPNLCWIGNLPTKFWAFIFHHCPATL